MKYLKLNNGVKMPVIGYGVYKISDDETEEAVYQALKAGYRLIDTASLYGNEAGVGRGLKKSKIPREEIFLTTKIWPDFFNYEDAKKAIQKSLDTLDVEYVDLFLIHQPFNDIYGVWRALNEFYENKKIRAIGVSNFYNDRIRDLSLWSGITPAVNQIEVNPFYQRKAEISYQQSIGVVIEAWGPFAQGKNNIFDNQVLKEIGLNHKKSVSQIILRWLTQQNIVAIPKSSKVERMKENIDIFDFELSANEMKIIDQINSENYQPFKHEFPESADTIYQRLPKHKK